jgi:hypothetical protein
MEPTDATIIGVYAAAAPYNHSQHNQVVSYEVLTSLVSSLLMMGIMMPETC